MLIVHSALRYAFDGAPLELDSTVMPGWSNEGSPFGIGLYYGWSDLEENDKPQRGAIISTVRSAVFREAHNLKL
ncbi:hypothetical protein DDZ15_05000 [Rhodohalobacter mucosus]|uniref:Uncharacterized protein n=1 Tax=Rhodohalobacter mucosus TaxID=2079485 RepID=A0A316TWJ9_9BACT|nr:hypothetical protein DDZ15_05000 [Rhodohalobacter mucosus]